MSAKKLVYLRFDQRSIVKSLVAEKSKRCEMYKISCNECGEARFSQKLFPIWLNMGLPRDMKPKDSSWSGNTYSLVKKKVPGSAVSKRLFRHGRIPSLLISFKKKSFTKNSFSYCQLFMEIHLIHIMCFIYIYIYSWLVGWLDLWYINYRSLFRRRSII